MGIMEPMGSYPASAVPSLAFLRHKTLSVGVTCEVRTALHNSTPIIMPPWHHGTARHQNS